MRVLYILPVTAQCGGIKVVAEHTTRLAARGHSAEWWGLQVSPTWFARHVPYRRFPSPDALGASLRRERDAAIIATFWTTATWVASNLRHSSRGYYLVQDLDGETYGGDPNGNSYGLGLHPITTSEWVTQQLRSRWRKRPTTVGIGIDHEVFAPLKVRRDRNRIFTAYRPSAGPNDLKGWTTALAVARAVCRANPETSLVTFGLQGTPPVPPEVPHLHVAGPDDAQLRALYAQAGCYLMSSRHEGFGLPAAEAMACATPVVATDAHGNLEFCRHAETALVGRSLAELSNHVTRLQRDEKYAALIGEAGRAFVEARYRWDAVIDRLEAALSAT